MLRYLGCVLFIVVLTPMAIFYAVKSLLFGEPSGQDTD